MITTCPHCAVLFHSPPQTSWTGSDKVAGTQTQLQLQVQHCHSCQRLIVWLVHGRLMQHGFQASNEPALLFPRATSRQPCPAEVPSDLAEDYRQACLVLQDSPKASAALSRGCLQHLLREYAKVPPSRDLSHEIQAVIDSNVLPSHLAEQIDALRTVGNFAAHPIKDKHTGSVTSVEPGEAEWVLDVLEGLFDFYFVAPAKTQARVAAHNAKLAAAGKPPLKG